MIKRIITISICLLSFITKAQISLIDDNGNTISDEQQFSFGTTTETPAKLHFYIKNDTSQEIGVKGEIIEINGADGSNVQFCLGECLFSITEGTVVPENDGAFNIAANSTSQGPGTYFWNQNSSNNLISYKFKIYQVNSIGNQVGDAITINYVYDSSLSTSKKELNELGVDISNTISSNEVNLQLSENVNATFYDLNGKQLFKKSLKRGFQSVNISMLNAGIYLVRFESESNGSSATAKIIKK